jgi:hypothetical protein
MTSRSRSTMRAGLQMRSDTMFDGTWYSNRGRTPLVTTHTARSEINTPMFFMWQNSYGETSRPQQPLDNLLMQNNFFTSEFLTIDHRQIILHVF